MKEFLDMGEGGIVARQRVVAVGRFASTPIRRAVHLARKEGRLIDLTYGRACNWVFFLDSGHVVLANTSDLSMEESEAKP
jgi:extracellular matrix regulatory protein A